VHSIVVMLLLFTSSVICIQR